MRMRKLGESGLFVLEMCFGAMTFGGTDGIWGQVGKLGQEDADELVIATKVASAMGDGPNRRGTSRGHILHEARASLNRLGLDYVDLYQIHAFDPSTPIEETLEALDTLVRSGDVRYIGLSNWAAWQIMKATGITRARHLAPITSLRAYYTLVGRDLEREIVPLTTLNGSTDGLEPARRRVSDRQILG